MGPANRGLEHELPRLLLAAGIDVVNERISWETLKQRQVRVRPHRVQGREPRTVRPGAPGAARPPGSEVDAVADSCPGRSRPRKTARRARRWSVTSARQAYEPVWRAMQRFTDQRSDADADELWVVEHDPVFTLGQAGKDEARAGAGRDPGAARGPRRPGDLSRPPARSWSTRCCACRGWALVCARLCLPHRAGPHRYPGRVEHRCRTPRGAPRASTSAGAKIAALGIRVRRGCTFHGLAFNVSHGPGTLPPHQPLWLSGVAGDIGSRLGAGPPGWRPSSRATLRPPRRCRPGVKQLGGDKINRSPVQFADAPVLRKPSWIRVRIPSGNAVQNLKAKLRENRLVTVCEEASCPKHPRLHPPLLVLRRGPRAAPKPPDANEPASLGQTVADMGLKYVVVTSVDRDDLRDGGAQHFVDCITAIREKSPGTRIEVLTPRFPRQGPHGARAGDLAQNPPDVFNHNIETVPDLYRNVRPGADYQWSLNLLKNFKAPAPGGADQERHHAGPGRGPTAHHHPVLKYWTPEDYKALEDYGYELGFSHVASGPMVRSSYHADVQAKGAGVSWTTQAGREPAAFGGCEPWFARLCLL
ncbi:unnamed protein product [Cylicocyclus nassatus]|uniref:BPL/LPL catalytic domain-containing protein n=1 Tax=Cylicocyclus nassatus TaxID=53992 RepID=A0AA36HHX3_CYLNA|nr:unnamed protein product [Cylicocyclus nassatus]